MFHTTNDSYLAIYINLTRIAVHVINLFFAVLHNLGYTYERIGELKEAIDFYQQSLDIKRSQVVNDEVGMVSSTKAMRSIC